MTDLPKSLRNETKNKFETLLKTALNSRSNNSPKSTRTFLTVSGNESISSFDNDIEKDHGTTQVEADIHVTKENEENFILTKFLKESDDNVTYFVENEKNSATMPTPKPRKKWIKPCSKETSKFQETENASLEFFLTNEKQSSSLSSVQTYIISNNQMEHAASIKSGSVSSEKKNRPSLNTRSQTSSSLHKNSDSSENNKKLFADKNIVLSASIDDQNNEKYNAELEPIDHNDHVLADNDEIYELKASPLPRKYNEMVTRNMLLEKTDKNLNISLESSINGYSSTNLSEKSDAGNEKKNTSKCENSENSFLAEEVDETHNKNIKSTDIFSKNVSIVEIVVHKTDKLKLESFAVRPAVKVHIVNGDTGDYLRWSDIKRLVDSSNSIYIEPVMTRSLYMESEINKLRFPTWEESLIVNEDFQYFLSESHNLIIFFELLGRIPLPKNYKDVSKEWYKIAWAFLKLRGSNDTLNVGKTVRLQLYYPGNFNSTSLPKCHIFEWWSSKRSKKYPSTLYVTIKELKLPRMMIEKFRSNKILPLDRSIINQINNDSQQNKLLISRHKGARRYCNFPNKLLTKFYSYQLGCLAIKFSNNGLYLACGMSQETTHFIAVFSTETFEQVFKFSGHEGLIYDIYWSKNDEFIISASSDCTVCVWSFETKKIIQILPHMSFVYCCAMITDSFITTGGYDKIFRIWKKDGNDEFKVCQEIENHGGFITSVCAKVDSSSIFSCDSVGKIVEWTLCKKHRWKVGREIILAELRGTIINQILLNDKETKLLIHARDSVVRLLDLKNLCVLQRFTQALNNTVQTFCTFCNCNRYVFCSSENGFIHVWDVNNGNSVAKYMPYYSVALYKDVEVHNVQFNPKKTQIAVASYNSEVPILLCGYDEQYKSFDLGLKYMSN